MPLNTPRATHTDSVHFVPKWFIQRKRPLKLSLLALIFLLLIYYYSAGRETHAFKAAAIALFVWAILLYFLFDPKVVARRKWREMSRPGMRSTLCPSCTYQITEHDLDEDDNFRCPECGSLNTFWIADHAWRRVLKLPDNDHSSESAPTS